MDNNEKDNTNNETEITNIISKTNNTNVKEANTGTLLTSESQLTKSGTYYLTNDLTITTKKLKIASVTLDGNNHKIKFSGDGEFDDITQTITFKNVIIDSAQDTFKIESTANFINCTFLNSDKSIKANDGKITFDKCTFNGITDSSAIETKNTGTVTITNSKFYNCKTILRIKDPESKGYLINCTIDSSSVGKDAIVQLDDDGILEVTNCNFTNCKTPIFYAEYGTIKANNVRINSVIQTAKTSSNFATDSKKKGDITFTQTEEKQKGTTTISVVANNVNVGYTSSIRFILTNNVGNVRIYYNITDSNDNLLRSSSVITSNSEALVNYLTTVEGKHYVFAKFEGNDNFEATSTTGSFIAYPTKVNPTLTVNADDTTVNKSNTITFTLKNSTKSISNAEILYDIYDSEGNVIILNNSVITNTNGIASVKYTPKTIGTYTVRASYMGDNNYYNSIIGIEDTFNVQKMSTSIDIIFDKANPSVCEDNAVTLYLKDDNGNIIYNQQIMLTIEYPGYEGNYNVWFPVSGQKIKLDARMSGTLRVNATYTSNNVYESTEKSSIITIKELNPDNRLNSVLEIIAPHITLEEALDIDNDYPYFIIREDSDEFIGINDGYIHFNITRIEDNEELNTEHEVTNTVDNEGDAYIICVPREEGTYLIQAYFEGTKDYKGKYAETLFIIGKIDSNIVINPVEDIKYNSNISITGTITDYNDNPIEKAELEITINDKIENIQTDENGSYAITYKANTMDINNITVKFNGNDYYNPSNAEQSFNVIQQDTIIIFDEINQKYTGDNVTISGKFLNEQGSPLINSKIQITINNNTATITTDNKGLFKTYVKATIIGTNNITAQYKGNKKYNAYSTSTTFDVAKQDTKISINPIENTKYNYKTTVSGIFTDKNGNALVKSNLQLSINNQTVTIKTDDKGRYNYTFKATTTGVNNITVNYKGNSRFNPSTISTNLNVIKQDTKITINKIEDKINGETITVTGKFTNEQGSALVNSYLEVSLNNKTKGVKTDTNGTYSTTFKVSEVGTNNVSVTYKGNAKYNTYTEVTIFNVEKLSTTLTLNAVADTKYNKNVTLSGVLIDETGKIVANDKISVMVNNKTATTTTNENGVFTYTFKAQTVGENNITVIYNENTRYEESTAKISFNVDKEYTILTVNTIEDAKYGDQITVTGVFRTIDGTPLIKSNVQIKINNQTVTVKTDDNGIYTYTFSARPVGKTSITVFYNGNSKYDKSSIKTTFNVAKQYTKIELNPIEKVSVGENVTITGKFTTATGKALINSGVTVYVNQYYHTLITDSQGKFNYTFTATDGNYDIVGTYKGNEKYFNCTSEVITISAEK